MPIINSWASLSTNIHLNRARGLYICGPQNCKLTRMTLKKSIATMLYIQSVFNDRSFSLFNEIADNMQSKGSLRIYKSNNIEKNFRRFFVFYAYCECLAACAPNPHHTYATPLSIKIIIESQRTLRKCHHT